jgi:cell division protein FtsB
VTHIGPTAQDFAAAFGLGGTETGIASVDADGVTLAAIQALEAENDELRSELAELRAMVEQLANG